MSVYQGTLVARARELLLETSIPTRRVAKELDMEYQWLLLFKVGKIKDPGCSKIQMLYEFLSGKKLELQ